MLPVTLAQDVKKQVLHYLSATFKFRVPEDEAALKEFLNDPERGLFKGPWVQVRRPFRPAENWKMHWPVLFDLPHTLSPFIHQWRAWQRLSSKGRVPQSTLVTTGTGSGKTECFLVPILDHCYREHLAGRRGIKAIILYPMNALAADQAARFAQEIFRREALCMGSGRQRQARIRVGLYTGRNDPGVSAGGQACATMRVSGGESDEIYQAITDHAAMQEDPPDILLTNYKMLDFLLMRPKDKAIWQHNGPDVLRYLVLDELHTYDGAQGADVACLIRRLKARLDIGPGGLCCIGTSATVAGGKDEKDLDPLVRLADFAGRLFEEDFKIDAIIDEDRLTAAEIIRQPLADLTLEPDPSDCLPRDGETAGEFARRIAPLWGVPAWPLRDENLNSEPEAEQAFGLALGEWLRQQPLFSVLLKATENAVLSWPELVGLLAEDYSLRGVVDGGARNTLATAFLALVAAARDKRGERVFPMLPTQVQLWLRELRRLGRFVEERPRFGWLDEVRPGQVMLPAANCSECGEAVWVALVDADSTTQLRARGSGGFQLISDPQKIYEGWGFERAMAPSVLVLSPWREADGANDGQLGMDFTQWFLAPESLVVRNGPGTCPLTDAPTFRVKLNNDTRRLNSGRTVGEVKCPNCNAGSSLMFIGAQAATIASVAIDEIFGSLLNNDPKLLAFTDSVQDASHRAGFFSARTYRFTFRTALQHLIDEHPEGVPVEGIGQRLLAFCARNEPGRPGNDREALSTLLPPDLREYGPYLDYRAGPRHLPPPPDLLKDMAMRLDFEVVSEFGLMMRHGRTLELNGSSCLGFEPLVVDETIALFRARLPAIDPGLSEVPEARWRLWLLGILHRQRERGGLYHPYIKDLAAHGFWGKQPFGRSMAGREIYPPASYRHTPRLLSQRPMERHDHVLATGRAGQQEPWHLLWARQALQLTHTPNASILDALNGLLKAGRESGLLVELPGEGGHSFFAISAGATRLYPTGAGYVCQKTGHFLFRPESERDVWEGAPSLAYGAPGGKYRRQDFNERQLYYQSRYRKGALRRVFAQEHTGLLSTPEREALEISFNHGDHADDPNVLTATSTLEMGIDIGDLSTTMLCSIPPTTASYLQRIGRAGRSTGTALVVAVINQRPHDLFFFARPFEMLSGRIEPPGCWLDASAVLVRQYLAFGFDSGVKLSIISSLPGSGKQLVEDLEQGDGPVSNLLAWMALEEKVLQELFLERFADVVQKDTRERFYKESATVVLRQRIVDAALDFDAQRQIILNARSRLSDQKSRANDQADAETIREIEQEFRILKVRQEKLNQTPALEVLIEYGLLPNYAFPERGVHLNAILYKESRGPSGKPEEPKALDIVRGGGAAIRELAPHNSFYTRGHEFKIEQLALGSQNRPLLREWAVCGECGHMRLTSELNRPEATPACPQCGYAQDMRSQLDRSQHREFLDFAESEAISYMEFYASLSGDRADERHRQTYRLVNSFDLTVDAPSGAVAEEETPFGIEYRAALVLRQVNTGFAGSAANFPFGAGQRVSDTGFLVCVHCGMVAGAEGEAVGVQHRRSCAGRRKTEKMQREGRPGDAYEWKSIYLYRELRSEAIRILLPEAEGSDLSTLTACLYLGLRLRFRGNPLHLNIIPQVLPQHYDGLQRHYLVLMDGVPGGTGFLKTLFQEKNEYGISGEGILDVMRRARDALEDCRCRKLGSAEDTDGCYECVRTYHLQYRSEEISRERGIRLLNQLLQAGEKREERKALDEIETRSPFGSLLEKRFIDGLQAFVVQNHGVWESALIMGAQGFRFNLPGQSRFWEVQLQPRLSQQLGVDMPCQPDFLLRADDDCCKPIAVFADGFEPHVRPHEAASRLADDTAKRRGILGSGQYWVWNICWKDFGSGDEGVQPLLVQAIVNKALAGLQQGVHKLPDADLALGNGFSQLQAFLKCPEASEWSKMVQVVGSLPLVLLVSHGFGEGEAEMLDVVGEWRRGMALPMSPGSGGSWVYSGKLGSVQDDLLVLARADDLRNNVLHKTQFMTRLDDASEARAGADYEIRWRRFLRLINLLQFAGAFEFSVTSEAFNGNKADLEQAFTVAMSPEWQAIYEDVVDSLKPIIKGLAGKGVGLPVLEHYPDDSGECFAELAWPLLVKPVALLVGDQTNFCSYWQDEGWTVVTLNELLEGGVSLLTGLISTLEPG